MCCAYVQHGIRHGVWGITSGRKEEKIIDFCGGMAIYIIFAVTGLEYTMAGKHRIKSAYQAGQDTLRNRTYFVSNIM